MASKKKYIEQIKTDMMSLNLYKQEYDATIDLLAQMYIDRDKALKAFDQEGCHYTIEKQTKNGFVKVKNPLFAIVQELNNSIVATNRELGLTPKGLKAIRKKEEAPQRESLLARVLMDAAS